MSDHISGPRALAEPIADITDLYAFPSPERPGHLVLVLNTLPFAPPSSLFSDGLVYRLLLRPLTRSEEHTSELQSPYDFVCRLLLEKKKNKIILITLFKNIEESSHKN